MSLLVVKNYCGIKEKQDKEQWSMWQKKLPDAETVSTKLDVDIYFKRVKWVKFEICL